MWYVVPWLGGIKFKSSAKIEDKNGDAIMKFAKKCPKDQTMDAINARVIRIKIDTRTHPSYNNNSNNNKDNDGNGDRKSPHEHIRSIIISWSNWYERPFEWEQQRERRKKDDLNDDAILCWKNSLHFCYVCWKSNGQLAVMWFPCVAFYRLLSICRRSVQSHWKFQRVIRSVFSLLPIFKWKSKLELNHNVM